MGSLKHKGRHQSKDETCEEDELPLKQKTSEKVSSLLTQELVIEMEKGNPTALRYTLTQIPPIPVALFIAMQHVLISLASALTMSSVIADTLCAAQGHEIRAKLFATTLFMQGSSTIVQTLLGVRLPVFQGASSSFLVPLIALSKNTGWTCSDSNSARNGYMVSNNTLSGVPLDLNISAWAATGQPPVSLTLEEKLQELSGSLMVASLVEVLAGGLGLLKPLLRLIGPITVAPTIALIGLSLFKLPVVYAKYNPTICLGSAVLVVIFALYMSNIKIPIPNCSKGGKPSHFPVFQLLPILIAMVLMWVLCGILTVSGVLPDDPSHQHYFTRTDAKMDILHNTPWFLFTYPGQFGRPSINIAATIGFVAAVMASLIESVGDYYAAAKCCQVRPPPEHAMSRGILVEGLASVLSGAVGAAHATTSYSGNIAMLSLTQTASRSVLVIAGAILVVLSLVGKVGAAMATLPPPILGGILLVVLGLLATLGISTLKYADMTSNRNLLITGVAFMTGLSVPAFVEQHGSMLNTGNESADQVIKVVLGTPMFLGGAIALFLDNTVPGTDLERGLLGWNASHSGGKNNTSEENVFEEQAKMAAEDDHVTDQKKDPDALEVRVKRPLTEDEIYGFEPLKYRFSSRLWRFVPFLPPNVVKGHVSSSED